LLRFRELRLARLLADDEAAGLCGDGVGDLRAARLQRGLRLVAREPFERAGHDVRAAGERAFDGPLFLARLEAQTQVAQLVDDTAVLVVAEPFRDRLRAFGTDALGLDELLLGGVHERVDVAEVPRECLRGHPAYIGDVQPEEHARERDGLRRLDRGDRVAGADLAVAVELHQLVAREPVQLGDGTDETELPQAPHRLFANAVDVRRGHHPVDQRLEPARWARAVGAAVHGLSLGLHHLGAAQRAVGRHAERLRPAAVRTGRTDDLRDDV